MLSERPEIVRHDKQSNQCKQVKRHSKQTHAKLTSFSMTAIRLPWVLVKMLFNKVVFPDPRKPVITCTDPLSVLQGRLNRTVNSKSRLVPP